ncbi:hypothetical protein LOZ39_002524 [Ophidiomyces ophidiicola]|nr:hypothetical protein LOZ64_001936 [Ophidiomyces ophidiicola]KAI2005920.1 hypothetical protein LOZ49_005234 [Ophidiomyces ophidiicola]KAI2017671.1 hypothetical protein LOZ46_004258 [Ophidiomyces ophidiicola]KAI2076770.1 hypothetical protein LOZ39_002524 [Ophidiomyces ophidiicola]KAI2136877.1 hypothetical protein LOZ29_003336 [Ophidiomyces ophidiicola]
MEKIPLELATLSPELLLEIADQTDTQRDLNNLAQTCHRLYDLLNHYLYRRDIKMKWKKAPAISWGIKNGSPTTVEMALDAGADVHGQNKHGETLLEELFLSLRPSFSNLEQRYCISNAVDILALLFDAGFDVNAEYAKSMTPLKAAIKSGCDSLVRLVVEKGADVVCLNDEPEWTLNCVYGTLDVPTIAFLIKEGIKLTLIGKDGESVLHRAARRHRPLTCQFLIDSGIAVEIRSPSEQTPLIYMHSSIYRGESQTRYENTVLTLIDNGANINAIDISGATAFHHACANCPAKSIEFLLGHGLNRRIPDNNGRSGLIWAIKRHRHRSMPYLLDIGMNVNARDDDGAPALHFAVTARSASIATKIIAAGADLDAQDMDGNTALHMTEDDRVAAVLVKHGANVTIRNDAGLTALDFARSARKSSHLIRFLAKNDPEYLKLRALALTGFFNP